MPAAFKYIAIRAATDVLRPAPLCVSPATQRKWLEGVIVVALLVKLKLIGGLANRRETEDELESRKRA
jgi:hypothetical protein